MIVIPGGLISYLQAGGVGIYKSFKDNLCKTINEWKYSDNVRYTRGVNPHPPEVELVVAWVMKAWRQTPGNVIEKSASMCGVSAVSTSWHIARHDVYGAKFRLAWELRDDNNVDSDNKSFEDLIETLDDIVIEN